MAEHPRSNFPDIEARSRKLGHILAELGALGPGYERALRVGLDCSRHFVDEDRQSSVIYALTDIVDEAPQIAVAAFRGSALDASVDIRQDTAFALRVLARRFPDQADELLQALSTDQDAEVRSIALESIGYLAT